MARKAKAPVRPLIAVRHEFVDSLDAATQAGLMLLQVCESVLEHEQIANKGIADMLKERADAFRATLFTEDEGTVSPSMVR